MMPMNKKTFIAVIVIFPLLISLEARVLGVAAQSSGSIFINPDGSVTGTDNIQRNGDVYTLTGNISGGIQVQKSYIVIDGAGYTVNGNGARSIGVDLGNGVGQDPSRTRINNVTVTKLRIINCTEGIGSENSNNNTFIGNYIEACETGFWIIGSSNNTLRYNTVKDCVTGISINYAGKSVIVENNIINNSLLVWLSTEPFVDGNYWSDYQTKYPNAKQIEKSGLPNLVWDIPYNYGGSLGNYTDNHPLIEPVVVPAFPIPSYSASPSQPSSSTPSALPTQTLTPSPSVPEFPTWIILSLVLAATLLMVAFVNKGRKSNRS